MERKKIFHAIDGLNIFVCAAAYILGLLEYDLLSDAFLLLSLFLIDHSLICGILYGQRGGEESYPQDKSIAIVFFGVAFLCTATIIRKPEVFANDMLTTMIAILIYIGFCISLWIVLRNKRQLVADIRTFVRKDRIGIGISLLFILFSGSELVSISMWDATSYLGGLDNFAVQFDMSFKTIDSANLVGHLSMGYGIPAGAFHMLFPTGNVGVKLYNILLCSVAVFCYYRILKRLKCGRFAVGIGTILMAAEPLILGIIGNISPDCALMAYFMIFLYCYLYRKSLLMIVVAMMLVMTKETAFIVYFFFWLGILIKRAGEKKNRENVGWNFWNIFSENEKKAIVIPMMFFLLNFLVCVYMQTGWPSLFVGGVELTAVHILLVLVMILILWCVLAGVTALWWRVSCTINPIAGYICCGAIIILPIVGVLAAAAVYGNINGATAKLGSQFGHLGLEAEHITAILKQAYVLHFSWLLLGIIVVAILYLWINGIRFGRGKKEFVISVIAADVGLLLFTLAYVTYQNPRYLQVHYAFLIILASVFGGTVLKGITGKKVWVVKGGAVLLAGLLLMENYSYIDPVTKHLFYNRHIGNGVLCSGSTDELGGERSSYSDRAVNNRVYSYYWRCVVKFLKQIEYDGSQIIAFPDYNNWVLFGRTDISTLDEELKHMISYDGNFYQSVIRVRSLNDLQDKLDEYGQIYYVDNGAIAAVMDSAIADYCGPSYTQYTTGAWSIYVYELKK